MFSDRSKNSLKFDISTLTPRPSKYAQKGTHRMSLELFKEKIELQKFQSKDSGKASVNFTSVTYKTEKDNSALEKPE